MKKMIIGKYIFLVCLGLISYSYMLAQAGIVLKNTNLIVSNSTMITIPGNVLIFGASDYILNNGNCYVGGDFTNNGNGLYVSGTGTVIFNGTSTQNINGSNPTTFYNLSKTSTNSVVIALDETVSHNLTLSNGTFSLNDHKLTTNGTINGSGTLTGSRKSGVILGYNGNVGTINFTNNNFAVSPPDSVNNYLDTLFLLSNTTATLGDSLNISPSDGQTTTPYGMSYGVLQLASGANLTTNDVLTLKSDKYGDGIVAQSLGTITGKAIVERYIYPKRAWRFLAVPVTSTQSINAAWQENATPNPNTYTQNNPKPGFGTEITNGSGYTSLGFDENTSQSNPSCKYWDSVANVWMPISTTYMPVNSHVAYCIFVRGSRAINLSQGTSATPDSTILRITGALNQITNTQSFTGVPVGNFIMVQNPYAAPLDFTNGTFSNVDNNSFYVFDPKLTGSNFVGDYDTYNAQLPTPHWLVTTGSYSASSPSVVQSGQAFFMQTINGTSGSVVYGENAKSTSEFNTTGKEAPVARATLYADLLLSNNGLALADRVAAVYGNKYSLDDTVFGSKKFWNEDESLSLWNGKHYYAVDCRPVPLLADTLFFRMYLYHGTPYTLRIFTQNVRAELPARGWLVDDYLHTKTEINLYDTTLYNFFTNPDTLSYRNRFMLVFDKQFVANPVPVTKVINQNNPGITGVSNSITVKASGVSTYPNPVSDNKAMLQFTNMDKGLYEATVYNAKGQKLGSNMLEHAGGDNAYSLSLNPSWAAGVYNISIINKDSKKTINLKLVISK